jgi:hypothetical protein
MSNYPKSQPRFPLCTLAEIRVSTMRKAIAIALFGTTLMATSTMANPARMSNSQGESHMWGNVGKPIPPTLNLGPTVTETSYESNHVSMNVDVVVHSKAGPKFLAKVTYVLKTAKMLAPDEAEALAKRIRDEASYFHVVGVRFNMPKAGANGTPMYDWFLFWDGRETVRNNMR